MYRNTHFLKHINITKHHCTFPEEDTNKVETSWSCINCKIIHICNNNAHFVSFNLHNFHLNVSIIEVQITLPVQAKDKFCFISFAFRVIVDYHTLYTLNSLTKRHEPGDVTASFWKFIPRDLAKRRLLCSFSSTLACMGFGCVVLSSTSQHGISGWFHFGSSSQRK